MHRPFAAFHRVPFALRMLTAAAALVTLLSLPTLWRVAPWPAVLVVAALGLFSASIAAFGRSPPEGRDD